MSERRRFFPATPVQQVPGRTVELEMQLRPLAPTPLPLAAPAPGGACELFGPGWLLDFESAWGWEPWRIRSTSLEDGRTRIVGEWGRHESFWVGTPSAVSALGHALPLPSANFRCERLVVVIDSPGVPLTYFCVLQGVSASQVFWEWTWDSTSPQDPTVSADGDVVYAWGNVLMVRAGGGVVSGGGGWPVEFVARAFCGGSVAGQITMRIERYGW